MIDTTNMTPAQIRRAAMEAVIREVGVSGLLLLLRDERPGSGDYLAERDALRPHFESMDTLMKAVAAEGAPQPTSNK